MKTKLIALASAALFLTGCAASSATPSDPVETFAVDDLSQSEREAVFLMVIETEYPVESADVGDLAFLELADSTCMALDSGVPMTTLVLEIYESGLEPEFGGFLLGASVSAFCPEYEGQLG